MPLIKKYSPVTNNALMHGYDGNRDRPVFTDEEGNLSVRNKIYNPDTLSWESATGSLGAGGAVEVTNFPSSYEVNNFPTKIQVSGLVPEDYDYVSLGYTEDNLTTVVYKTGGSGGTVVATLTLSYTGSVLQSITRS